METVNQIRKVFVTGADGMLGSSICRELIKQDYQVKAMVLPKRKSTVLSGLCIETVRGDILDKLFLEREMKDCEWVIHAAALTTLWPRRSRQVMSVNLEGTKNVMEVAQKHQLKRMVYISSASSFSPGDKDNPGNENSEFSWHRFGMDYITSKYLAQKMLLTSHSHDNFPVIIINPTFMIGPYDSAPSSGRILLDLYANRIPGYPSGGKNFVSSKDVAIAVVNALKHGRLGECYIAGNENMEYAEFLRKACKIGGKKFKLIKVPQVLLLIIGFFNSGMARLTNKPPKLSFTMARVAGVGQYFSSEKAQKELKMPQTPIEIGIEQCMNWFKSNGYYK